ncbi:MAG: type IV secretion system protein, partial [Acetobacteraceae bacterium]
MTGFNVFEFIYQTYLTSIAGAISSVVDKALAAAQGPLDVTLILLLMIYGYEVITAQGTTFRQAMTRFMRIAVVVFLVANASAYNYYVVSFFTTGLPNFFAQHIAGAPGGTNPGATFDTVLTSMWYDTTLVWRNAPGWIKAIFFDMAAFAAFGIVACSLVVMFAVFLVVQMLIGVTVTIGPILILGWLFDYTRKIVNGWIDVLLTLSLVTLTVNVLLELLVTAMKSTLDNTVLTGPATDQLLSLLGIALVVLVLSASVLVLPRMIERIAGGVAAGVGLEGARHWIHGAPAWRTGGLIASQSAPVV